ncbi:MAG: fasciclin domain-containing protein [Planctomycetota bacterium]
MSNRVCRWMGVVIPVLALTCGAAFAQEPPKPEAKDVLGVAAGAPNLSTFVELVKLAGLDKELAGKGPFTVFAPSNDAFKKVPNLDDLRKPESKERLANLLKNHVVASKVDLKTEKVLKPLAGAPIMVSTKDDKVMLNVTIAVVKDHAASNGTLYAVDGVIMAPAVPKPPEKPPVPPTEEPKKEPAKKPEGEPAKKPAEPEKH